MIVQVDPGPTKKKKPANTTMLGFFAGKPSKSKKYVVALLPFDMSLC
jgi:hypothetical protein